MKPITTVPFFAVLVAVCCTLGVTDRAAAQTPPPIDGVTGTVATDGTIAQEHAAANTVIVKAVDGVEHMFHDTALLLFHGRKSGGVEALDGLRDGTTVAVHHMDAATDTPALGDQITDEALETTEGTVVRIDRGRQKITIRFDDGQSERFQLSDQPAVVAGSAIKHEPAGAVRIVVSYTDDAGDRVAHLFTETS